MSRPRVLVTGATGFVGRALVPRLLAHTDVTLLLLEEYAGGLPLPAPLDRLRPEYSADTTGRKANEELLALRDRMRA